MGLYERYVLPKLIDVAMRHEPIADIRAEMLPLAEGRVLELGIGSGLNLRYYDPQRVRSVTGVDPSEGLTAKARERAEKSPVPVEFLGLSGEDVPLESRSFDTAVITWTLCSIPNVYRALEEVRRLLAPGGRIVFAEHGRAPDEAIRRWQDRITPVWKVIGGGCHLNRPIDRLIEDAGFHIEGLEQGYVEGPKIASYMYRGRAKAR